MELEDINLLAKLAPGDMIALEAKFHRKYFRNLYNRARALYNVDAQNDSDNGHFHGIAFAELVALMEEHRREEGIAPIFKLTGLAFMYQARLEQLGVGVAGHTHTSLLKMRLMSVFPDLRAHSQDKHSFYF